MSTLNSMGIDTKTFKDHSVRGVQLQQLHLLAWMQLIGVQNLYFRGFTSTNQIGVAVLSAESTNSLQACWYVIRVFWNVITWMVQITEWLPAILDYMRNVRWTYQHSFQSYPWVCDMFSDQGRASFTLIYPLSNQLSSLSLQKGNWWEHVAGFILWIVDCMYLYNHWLLRSLLPLVVFMDHMDQW